MKNKVFVLKTSPKTLRQDLEIIVGMVGLDTYNKNKETLIKVNGNCNKYYPGSNTSPWFLDALLSLLKEQGFKHIKVIEGNLFEFTVEDMLEKTLLGEVLRKHEIQCVNYERLPRDKSGFPKMLRGAQLINIPVMHTHGFAKISVATKNYWGFLPVTRRHLHKRLNELLLKLYKEFPALTIVDGTVGMVGDSTRTGIPCRLDIIMGGWDNLAIDRVAAAIMGFEEQEIPLLVEAKRRKILPEFIVKGDFTNKTIPKKNFFYSDTLERKVTRWLEGLSTSNPINAVTSTILHAPIVDWIYNQSRILYNNRQFKNNNRKIFTGPWMYYEKVTSYIDYSKKQG